MNCHLSVTHKNEDAAGKWCPFSGAHDVGQGSTVRKMRTGRNCLTTGCMAWVDETDPMYEVALGRCGLVNCTGR